MAILQYARERKKLLLFIVILYVVAFHIIYNYYWKQRTIVPQLAVSRILDSIWNFQSSSTNGTDVLDAPQLEYDVHIEHPVLGHTGEVSGGNHSQQHAVQSNVTTIAIGGGITSKGVKGVDASNMAAKFQLFHTFLPTFCKTASPGYDYRFYFAYDSSDPVFSHATLLAAFQRTFVDQMKRLCDIPRTIRSSIHMVQCSHTGRPTWAQNDAMLEGYIDHADYFYRVNDDTRMDTAGWVEAFIGVLEHYNPPLVGVVGPRHSGGNVAILTYDFVHRTHVDIFGFYYPRLFTDWWGDDWVTVVYRPKRSTKLNSIRLAHTLGLGQRYRLYDTTVGGKLAGQLSRDTKILSRYIEALNANKASGVKPDGRKVISMSLYGKDPRYTWGVIRNAQLVPVYLPEWTLRVYVAADPAPAQLAVPSRIINKLRLLGAEVAHVSASTGNNMAPRNWRLLAADDQNLDYFLVRDADTRLSDRETSAVRDWLSTSEKNGPRSGVIHCVRDHPKHVDRAIVDGLWGARPRPLRQLLNKPVIDFLGPTKAAEPNKLGDVLWPAVAEVAYCHDSVSACDRWSPSSSRHRFPSPRQGQEYLGRKFDEHQELYSKDGTQVQPDVMCPDTSNDLPSPANFTTLKPTV